MKILITTGIFPPDVGGPATQIERLASDLAKTGFDVTVLTYGTPEKKPRAFGLFGVSRKIPAGLRQFIYGFFVFCLAGRADAIYTTDLYSPGYFSMLAAKFFGKKFVVRFAGDSAWEAAFNGGLIKDDIVVFQKKVYGAEIENLKKRRTKILKSADAVIAVSGFMKNLAEKIGVSSDRITVIYNAVDFFVSVPVREEPVFPVLVFSGRLTPWKGVEMLIKAVAGLKQKYTGIVFEIIGDGPESQNLKDLSRRLGMEKNIRFRGKMSEPESQEIFARSTIFVLNSNYEGLSHAILNAMNVGVPVVVSDIGGNPETVQNDYNGFLVPYNDEKEWHRAISILLEDKGLRERFVQNGKKVLENFRWEELIKKTIGVLNNL